MQIPVIHNGTCRSCTVSDELLGCWFRVVDCGLVLRSHFVRCGVVRLGIHDGVGEVVGVDVHRGDDMAACVEALLVLLDEEGHLDGTGTAAL